MQAVIKTFLHLIIVFFLTIISQIGGVIWLLCFCYFKIKKSEKKKGYKAIVFCLIYLIVSLIAVPQLAKLNIYKWKTLRYF